MQLMPNQPPAVQSVHFVTTCMILAFLFVQLPLLIASDAAWQCYTLIYNIAFVNSEH